MPAEPGMIVMGRVTGAWGVKGWIKLQPLSADPATLCRHAAWWLRGPGSAGAWREVKVNEARVHGATLIAVLADTPTREAAEGCKGCEVGLPRTALPEPGEGEFYRADLEGFEVVNRQGVLLGRLAGFVDNGAHPLLRVLPAPGTRELLIPFVPVFVDGIDRAAGRIAVDWQADY